MWNKQLRKVTEEVEEASDEKDTAAVMRTVSVFEVEKLALKHTRAPGHY